MSIHTREVTPIDVETNTTLTGATVELRVAPPNAVRNGDGTISPVFTYTGMIQGTTQIRHLKTATTFHIAGVWIVQARVTFSDGDIKDGLEGKLTVSPSL